MTEDEEILEFFMEAARIQALVHTGPVVDPHDHSPPCGGYDDCPYPDCLVDGFCPSASKVPSR